MCGRYQSATPAQLVLRFFQVDDAPPNYPPRWNAAPTQRLPVVRYNRETGKRSLDLLQWGLVPRWARNPKMGFGLINARGETIASKPAFRDAFLRRRCIVAADGFYEWQAQTRGKQPYAIRPLDKDALFGFAGVWEGWKDPATGEWLRTFAIVTTEANELLAPLHERMPVILRPDDYARWLGEEPATTDDLLAMLKPYPSEEMRIWPVSPLVSNVRNEGPELIEPTESRPLVPEGSPR